jgi:hypothetical protein
MGSRSLQNRPPSPKPPLNRSGRHQKSTIALVLPRDTKRPLKLVLRHHPTLSRRFTRIEGGNAYWRPARTEPDSEDHPFICDCRRQRGAGPARIISHTGSDSHIPSGKMRLLLANQSSVPTKPLVSRVFQPRPFAFFARGSTTLRKKSVRVAPHAPSHQSDKIEEQRCLE